MAKPRQEPMPNAESVEHSRAGRKRYPAAQRRELMLDAAAAHFAQHGFASPTRAIAAELGVTQGLIYKYFGTKDQLITQTLDRALGPVGTGVEFVAGTDVKAALVAHYIGFVSGATETRMRLFMRAGLDGLSWPTRRGDALTRHLFLPVIAALRQQLGLPDFDDTPAMRGERELVMMLHASMVFLGIRRHVYGMPMPERLDDVIAQNVEVFLTGAPATLRGLLDHGAASLKVQLMVRPD